MKDNIIFFICFIFGLSITMPIYAAEQDGKFYPGTMCKIADMDHEHRNKLRFGKFGFVVNQSSNNRVRVVCPIIRDEMNTNRGVTVRVFFHDSHPSEALACDLLETDVLGHRSVESNRAETPDFIPVNVSLGTICNTEVLDRFPQHFPSGSCSFTLKTQDSSKWNRSNPGTGLHLICGLPPRTDRNQFPSNNLNFSGRSGIGGYFVEETLQ